MTDAQCNGICVTAADIGVDGYGVGNDIAYPHPDCERHGPPRLPRRDSSRVEYAVRYWEGENGRWERVLPAESRDDAHNFIRYLEKREEQIRETVTAEEFAKYDFTRELLTRTIPHWSVIE